jgi:hypothetical protein
MRVLIAASMLLSVPLALRTQSSLQASASTEHPPEVSVPSEFKKRADEAHKAGNIEEEIEYRRKFSRAKWAAFSINPSSLDEYARYDLVDFNDLPLALLLEGSHRFAEAEQILRHNQAELSSERIAGNEIKAQNELSLAHLLARDGNQREAVTICSHWKGRMKGLAGRQDSAHIYGTPKAPVYDTPEVEVARWHFACGNPDEGFRLIAQQVAAHPHMLASFEVLENYYSAEGNSQMARKAELDGTLAVAGQ